MAEALGETEVERINKAATLVKKAGWPTAGIFVVLGVLNQFGLLPDVKDLMTRTEAASQHKVMKDSNAVEFKRLYETIIANQEQMQRTEGRQRETNKDIRESLKGMETRTFQILREVKR